MRFQPKTEKEVARLFEKGTYRFEVTSAKEAISQSTKQPMMKLILKVFAEDGRVTTVFDNLMTGDPNWEFKLRHFCIGTGLLSKYEKGELTEKDCVDVKGEVMLKIKVDKTGQYPDKNEVEDYVIEKEYLQDKNFLLPSTRISNTHAEFNDDIPY